jgi:hypothetical protein
MLLAASRRIRDLHDIQRIMAAIPRDHRRYTPAGWMQEEFSPMSDAQLTQSTKEEIRRLELAWQASV